MAELFKFRCYQCQKLIGAPRSRFGSVVKCPKCGVELIVPSPDDESLPEPETDPDAFSPEDLGIRLEPEPLSKPVASTSPALAPVGPDPIAFLNRLDEVGERLLRRLRGNRTKDQGKPSPALASFPSSRSPASSRWSPGSAAAPLQGPPGRPLGPGTWSSPGRPPSPGRCSPCSGSPSLFWRACSSVNGSGSDG